LLDPALLLGASATATDAGGSIAVEVLLATPASLLTTAVAAGLGLARPEAMMGLSSGLLLGTGAAPETARPLVSAAALVAA
jgi:hypothetical protein